MTEQREWLSIAELADWLGIPVRTVYRWNHFGTGPPRYRIGGHNVRYRRSEVEEWLAQYRRHTAA